MKPKKVVHFYGRCDVIAKGKSSSIRAEIKYYNILSPRKGMYYLGAYLDDFYNNLLEPGKASVNAYFKTNSTIRK